MHPASIQFDIMQRRPAVNGKDNDSSVASGFWEVPLEASASTKSLSAKVILYLKDTVDKLSKKMKSSKDKQKQTIPEKILGTLNIDYSLSTRYLTKENPMMMTKTSSLQTRSNEQLLVFSIKIHSIKGYSMDTDFLVVEINGLFGNEKSSQVLEIVYMDHQEMRLNFKRSFYTNRQSLIDSAKKPLILKLIKKNNGGTNPELLGYAKISLINLQVLSDPNLLSEETATPPIPIETGTYELTTIDCITKAFLNLEIVVGTLAWIDNFGYKSVHQPSTLDPLKIGSLIPSNEANKKLTSSTNRNNRENEPANHSQIDHELVNKIQSEFDINKSHIMKKQADNFYKRSTDKPRLTHESNYQKLMTSKDRDNYEPHSNAPLSRDQDKNQIQKAKDRNDYGKIPNDDAEAISKYLYKKDFEDMDNIFDNIKMVTDVDASDMSQHNFMDRPLPRPGKIATPQPDHLENQGSYSFPQPPRIMHMDQLNMKTQMSRSLSAQEYNNDDYEPNVVERIFGSRTHIQSTNQLSEKSIKYSEQQSEHVNETDINNQMEGLQKISNFKNRESSMRNQTDKGTSNGPHFSDYQPSPYSRQIQSSHGQLYNQDNDSNNEAPYNLVTVPSQELSNKIGFQTFNPNINDLPKPSINFSKLNAYSNSNKKSRRTNSQLAENAPPFKNPIQVLISFFNYLTENPSMISKADYISKSEHSYDEVYQFIEQSRMSFEMDDIETLFRLLDPNETGAICLKDLMLSHRRFIDLKIELFHHHFAELTEYCDGNEYTSLIEELQLLLQHQNGSSYASVNQFTSQISKSRPDFPIQIIKSLELLGFYIHEDQVYLPNILNFLTLASITFTSSVKQEYSSLMKKIETLLSANKLFEFDQSLYCEAECRYFIHEICTPEILEELKIIHGISAPLNIKEFHVQLKNGILGQTSMKLIDYYLLFNKVQEFIGKESYLNYQSSVSMHQLQGLIENEKVNHLPELKEIDDLNEIFNSKASVKKQAASIAQAPQGPMNSNLKDDEVADSKPLAVDLMKLVELNFQIGQLSLNGLPNYFADRLASLRFQLKAEDEVFESRSFVLQTSEQTIPFDFQTSFKFKAKNSSDRYIKYFVDQDIQFIEVGLFLKGHNRKTEKFASVLISVSDIEHSGNLAKTALVTPLVSFFQKSDIKFDGTHLGVLSYSFEISASTVQDSTGPAMPNGNNRFEAQKEVIFNKELSDQGSLFFILERLKFNGSFCYLFDTVELQKLKPTLSSSTTIFWFEIHAQIVPFANNQELNGRIINMEAVLLSLPFFSEQELFNILATVGNQNVNKFYLKANLTFTEEIYEYFNKQKSVIGLFGKIKDAKGDLLASFDLCKGSFSLKDLLSTPNSDGLDLFVDLSDKQGLRSTAVFHVNYSDEDLYSSSIIKNCSEANGDVLTSVDVLGISGFTKLLANKKLRFRLKHKSEAVSQSFVIPENRNHTQMKITDCFFPSRIFSNSQNSCISFNRSEGSVLLELVEELGQNEEKTLSKVYLKSDHLGLANQHLRPFIVNHAMVEMEHNGVILYIRCTSAALNRINHTQGKKLSESVFEILNSEKFRSATSFKASYPFKLNESGICNTVSTKTEDLLTFLKRDYFAVKSEVDYITGIVSNSDTDEAVDIHKLFPPWIPFCFTQAIYNSSAINSKNLSDLIQDFLFYDEELSGCIEEPLFDQIASSFKTMFTSTITEEIFKKGSITKFHKATKLCNYVSAIATLIKHAGMSISALVNSGLTPSPVLNLSNFKKIEMMESEVLKETHSNVRNSSPNNLRNNYDLISASKHYSMVTSMPIDCSTLVKTFDIAITNISASGLNTLTVDGKKPNSYIEVSLQGFSPETRKSKIALRDSDPVYDSLGKFSCTDIGSVISSFKELRNHLKVCLREFSADYNQSVKDVCRTTIDFSLEELMSSDCLLSFLDAKNPRTSENKQITLKCLEYPKVSLTFQAIIKKNAGHSDARIRQSGIEHPDLSEELHHTLMTLREIKKPENNPFEETPAFDEKLFDFIINNVQSNSTAKDNFGNTYVNPVADKLEPSSSLRSKDKYSNKMNPQSENSHNEVLKFESFAEFNAKFDPAKLPSNFNPVMPPVESMDITLKESQKNYTDDENYITNKTNPFVQCLGDKIENNSLLQNSRALSNNLEPKPLHQSVPIPNIEPSFGNTIQCDNLDAFPNIMKTQTENVASRKKSEGASKLDDDVSNRSLQMMRKIPKNLFTEAEMSRINRLINSKKIAPEFFDFDSDAEDQE